MFTKVLGCSLGASRFSRTVAIRVGTGMIPRGGFCMVVAQVGLGLKAISQETYSLIVFMAVTVAILTPIAKAGLLWRARATFGRRRAFSFGINHQKLTPNPPMIT